MDPANPRLSHFCRSMLISTWRVLLPGGSSWADSWSQLVVTHVVSAVEGTWHLPEASIAMADIVVKHNLGSVAAQAFHQNCHMQEGELENVPATKGGDTIS